MKRGGKLEEFLVSRNPLVLPSITSFDMGGPHQAFSLFEEYINAEPKPLESELKEGSVVCCKKPLKRDLSDSKVLTEIWVQDFQKPDLCICCAAYKAAHRAGDFRRFDLQKTALDMGTQHVCNFCAKQIVFHAGFMFVATATPEHIEDGERKLPVNPWPVPVAISVFDLGQESAKPKALRDAAGSTQNDHAQQESRIVLKEDVEVEKRGSGVKLNTPEFYYFSAYRDNPKMIAEVRNAESTLLLLKRQMYFDRQMKAAKEARSKSKKDSIPKSLEEFQQDLTVDRWNGKARVTDVDLYFNLLVFNTKPQFSTCQVLWDKWVELRPDKPYMSKEEWNDLCEGVEVSLPEDVRMKMWDLMSWRKENEIIEKDFVAAWHIHDVETVDPWINRLAKVLQLEYYDMEVEELQNRLKAKSAQEATPQIDFDQDPDESSESGSEADVAGEQPLTKIEIQKVEGERRIHYSPLEEMDDAPMAAKAQLAEGTASKAEDLYKKVSLTTSQYKDLDSEMQGGDGGSDADLSDAELSSDALSEESDTDESEFDAQAYDQAHQYDHGIEPETAASAARLVVKDDAGMKKLMGLKTNDFYQSKEVVAKAKSQARPFVKMKEKREGEPKKQIRDKKYKTDVYEVRQAIRRVYRNLPHNDFVKLINFLLRGMQLMRHGGKDSLAYWHGDDPTFKHTMGILGSNVYPRDLLRKMGFVTLSPARGGTVWAWPSKLLDAARQGRSAWGEREVPQSCPGKDRHRLDDMIALLKSCQRNLHRAGPKFSGHFKEQLTSS